MKTWRYILGFPRTVYFNFRTLPFGQAMKLPIIVSHKTTFRCLKGNIVLGKIKTGIVKIGFGETQATEFLSERTVINLKDTWQIDGRCKIGAGSKIYIGAVLSMGDRFNMTGRSTIVCKKGIRFGEHNLLSWDVLVMDTDQHNIYNKENRKINPDRTIQFGDDVWIGANAIVLKGVKIPKSTVIAAGAIVTKSFEQSNTIIAGSPAAVISEEIYWD